MRVVGVVAALTRTDGLVAAIVADVQPLAISGIESQTRRKERSPARLHLILQRDLDAVAEVGAQGQRIRHDIARHRRGFLFQREDLAFRHGQFDLAFEIDFDRLRRLRMELQRAVQGHDVEAFHRGVGRADALRRQRNAERIRALRQRLQVRCFLVEHAHDAPSSLGEV